MSEGTIRKLIHLSAGTNLPVSHLIASHNGVGYGYITSPEGDVFFDNLGLTNLRFDQLQEEMIVEYTLDNLYRRASSVTVTDDRSQAERQASNMSAQKVHAGDGEAVGESPAEPIDAVEESSLESFPASDSPAHHVTIASKPRLA